MFLSYYYFGDISDPMYLLQLITVLGLTLAINFQIWHYVNLLNAHHQMVLRSSELPLTRMDLRVLVKGVCSYTWMIFMFPQVKDVSLEVLDAPCFCGYPRLALCSMRNKSPVCHIGNMSCCKLGKHELYLVLY